MAPPSQLAIATSSVQRLVKEEASYRKELTGQEKRLEKLLASTEEDENREYSLKQEVRSSVSLEVVHGIGWHNECDVWFENQLPRCSMLEPGR
jgi:hypothetical protein